MKIYNCFTNKVIYECDETTMRATILKALNEGANLLEANLSWADLSEADLSKANLSKANLSKANLSKADLFGANLSKADLSKADLSGSILCDVLFKQTKITYRNKTVEVNFKEVK